MPYWNFHHGGDSFKKNRSIDLTPCSTCLHELDISYQQSINIYGSCMMHLTSLVRFAGRRSPIAFWASKTSSLSLVCCSCPPHSLSPSQSPFFIKTSNYELFMAISALSSSETKSAINHLNFDVIGWSWIRVASWTTIFQWPLTDHWQRSLNWWSKYIY